MTPSFTGRIEVDIAVVGSGFAGSLTAMALLARGRRVALIERGRHPRFAIGESSTPLANLLLEELADRYDLPHLRPFSKWGTWQRAYPEVPAGRKRGFTFLFHSPSQAFADTVQHQRQLMVAASPHDEVADTHWYRSDFDHWLVRAAEAGGAIYLDQTALDPPRQHGSRVRVDGNRHGQRISISAEFLVDATGPRGFMHQALGFPEERLRWLPPVAGLYSHFDDVAGCGAMLPTDERPPYPADDAAVHHVMPGGWLWVLKFNNGVTSAGAALTQPLAARIGYADGEAGWHRLLAMLPSVRAQFGSARTRRPFVTVPTLAFRSACMTGPWWAQLPSAAGVIDPLLSTGFPLTLLGVHRLLDILERTTPGRERDTALRDYAAETRSELDATEMLVAALYAAMDDPPLFKALARLYFAAASFSEAARRLGHPELAPGFLLEAHPRFGRELRACAMAVCRAPRCATRTLVLDRIARAIEPFDIAGLLDVTRRDWHPVLARDLLDNAAKLQADRDDLERLLLRSGLRLTV